MSISNRYYFVLGKNSLGIQCIKTLLSLSGMRWHQPKYDGFAHCPDFTPNDVHVEIKNSKSLGRTINRHVLTPHGDGRDMLDVDVIFVECCPRDNTWSVEPTLIIDRYTTNSNQRPSVLQVITLLRENGFRFSSETLRYAELVASYEIGGVPALFSIGATRDEMKCIATSETAGTA